MIKRFFLSGLIASMMSGPIHAQDSTPNAHSIEQGKQLFQSCASCHGQDAEGQKALGAPPLAGQLPSYLERAMTEFASGKRGKEDHYAQQMSAMSGLLQNEAQRNAIVTYLSSLKTKDIQVPNRSSDAAYRLYQANCGGCHGVKAEGNKALNSPRLAGMDAAYLQRQLEHFKSGKRGGSSRYAKQMQMMANTLKNADDIALVSKFISTL
ncbi:c-type cytochrome [Pseudoteredinibacter isoporae]|uniref:Cytochrome c oxidase subunit 2 n=1 Tax=Pseudoteredinibacter isoporae TaxID=570281 RepID=A0A7X0JX35_9GAMM|nr:c-type cytochrome [Pseudoteredinibacter isoporae]MBB6522876.1 cytochrome c oxidase subunit 2 [Pseudoteredinibacter isoporae]NHO88402.1 c-type cytochrome [Pseudoteredinibacter isoporae]NIB23267.1 c-type cytochrome [Pseudoteredinibacter isoporae]